MKEVYLVLKDTLLLSQYLAAVTGAIYFFKLKNSYWKWFSIYLIVIFMLELILTKTIFIHKDYKVACYVFFVIPLEFVFFYWLYAFKLLKNKKMFLASTLIYVTSIGVLTFLIEHEGAISLSINIGSIILIGLLILEITKQIKTDDILKFKENKMFYINIGLVLFYIGSYPYHAFGYELSANYPTVYNIYSVYFLVTNCIMYLLFSASFIWGKT